MSLSRHIQGVEIFVTYVEFRHDRLPRGADARGPARRLLPGNKKRDGGPCQIPSR